jgi:hypothetical protein
MTTKLQELAQKLNLEFITPEESTTQTFNESLAERQNTYEALLNGTLTHTNTIEVLFKSVDENLFSSEVTSPSKRGVTNKNNDKVNILMLGEVNDVTGKYYVYDNGAVVSRSINQNASSIGIIMTQDEVDFIQLYRQEVMKANSDVKAVVATFKTTPIATWNNGNDAFGIMIEAPTAVALKFGDGDAHTDDQLRLKKQSYKSGGDRARLNRVRGNIPSVRSLTSSSIPTPVEEMVNAE